MQDEEFIIQRKMNLEIFLNKILTNYKLFESKIFKDFIENVNLIRILMVKKEGYNNWPLNILNQDGVLLRISLKGRLRLQ